MVIDRASRLTRAWELSVLEAVTKFVYLGFLLRREEGLRKRNQLQNPVGHSGNDPTCKDLRKCHVTKLQDDIIGGNRNIRKKNKICLVKACSPSFYMEWRCGRRGQKTETR